MSRHPEGAEDPSPGHEQTPHRQRQRLPVPVQRIPIYPTGPGGGPFPDPGGASSIQRKDRTIPSDPQVRMRPDPTLGGIRGSQAGSSPKTKPDPSINQVSLIGANQKSATFVDIAHQKEFLFWHWKSLGDFKKTMNTRIVCYSL